MVCFESKGPSIENPFIHVYVFILVVMVTGYEFKKPDDQIHTILQDPTGQHLLVCFRSTQECYYITRNAKKPRQLNKMKVYMVIVFTMYLLCSMFMETLYVTYRMCIKFCGVYNFVDFVVWAQSTKINPW